MTSDLAGMRGLPRWDVVIKESRAAQIVMEKPVEVR
jgi:hypothetical protein